MTRTTITVNRASRLQLRAKLDLARHAIGLLRNKEEALRREQARLEGHASRTEQEWTARCSDAMTWLMRARALGASNEIAAMLDHPFEPAAITIAWHGAMGVTYPGAVDCTRGAPTAPTTTAALAPAAAAYQDALIAGATHAAATTALQRLEDELANTRKRRRAIEQRLQPRLETQLHQLDLDLDERDRDTAVRTQLAIRRKGTSP
jgi:vacuolar-type H+-ATPase subunit D/Vma8